MATTTSSDYKPFPLVNQINQSPPIDFSIPYDPAWISGKTVLITGGASGFGAGMARRWASYGATVMIGDINSSLGEKVVHSIRSDTNNSNSAHFLPCNVTSWESQVAFFKAAVALSPHGGIDVVVANAGIAGADNFEEPEKLDQDAPPKPNLRTLEVNLIGVLYTTHLALFWLPRNPTSEKCSPKSTPSTQPRDRHLLLMGSMASLSPIPGQPLYGASKHAVLGLFRTLRSTSWVHGIRVNLLCPYFIDTPILPAPARALLAGGATGEPEDVVEAATRLAADTRIVGRSLYIGPKMAAVQDEKGEWQLTRKRREGAGLEKAIWEAYAEDFEDSELWARSITRLLNQVMILRGWKGYWVDMWKAVMFGVLAGPRKLLGGGGGGV